MSSTSPQSAPVNPFSKRIAIEINRNSWKGPYLYPNELAQTSNFPQIDFGSALLFTSLTALVQSVPRWRSAMGWAQIKYAYSLDSTSDLRLHPQMVHLDKHQKSVLSDEWGVGVSLEWLTDIFPYILICHGDAAIRELLRMNLLEGNPVTKKIGPDKSPDFIAVTSEGRLHIIECKGSTKGKATIKKAFETAHAQKCAIKFKDDAKFVSQRFSIGLAIARDRNAKTSTLYVEDPAPDETSSNGVYLVKDEATLEKIHEAVSIAMLLEHCTLAGAFDARAAFVRAHQSLDKERELAMEMVKFKAEDSIWIGQEFEIISPVPLIEGHRQTVITLRTGMSPQLHEELVTPQGWDNIGLHMRDFKWSLKPTKSSTVGKLSRSIRFGNSFIEELRISERVAQR